MSIGFITTLSGPGGYLGEDAPDGFMQTNHVKIFTGTIFTNVALAWWTT